MVELKYLRLPVVNADNFVLGHQLSGVDETLNAVLDEVVLVNRLHVALGHFKHK